MFSCTSLSKITSPLTCIQKQHILWSKPFHLIPKTQNIGVMTGFSNPVTNVWSALPSPDPAFTCLSTTSPSVSSTVVSDTRTSTACLRPREKAQGWHAHTGLCNMGECFGLFAAVVVRQSQGKCWLIRPSYHHSQGQQ